VAAGAAVLVLVAVGLPILYFSGGESTVSDQSPTTIAVSPPTVPSTTAPLVQPVTEGPWQQVGVDVMEPIVGILDMEAVGSGLVAVGFDPSADFRQDGVIFTSDDGIAWTRLAENDPALTTGTVLMSGIVEGGPGLVAVGWSCPDDGSPCEDGPFPTVWSSVDGTSWNRSPVDVSIGTMQDVVATDNGLVAAGHVAEWVDDVLWSRPTIWTSPDGVNWSQAWQDDPAQNPDWPPSRGVILKLAVNPDGLIIALGKAEDGVGGAVIAVWISTNGQDWERVEADSAAFTVTTGLLGVIPLDATWGPAGFVVVGSEASEGDFYSASGFNVAIWRSPDGRAWTRVDTTDQDFGTTGSLSSIAALGSGYVAAGPSMGFVDEWPSTEPVTVWTSLDGSRWNQVLEVDGQYAQAIVVIDNATVIAGATYANNDNHAAVWAGPSFDPENPPPFQASPTPEPAQLAAPTGIAAIEEGVTCEEIAAGGFPYRDAVSYWLRYELTEEFDLDVDGAPCADAYTDAEVTELFGEPDALAVHLIARHPTGTFTATGPAVDAGLVCAEGTIDYTEDPDVDNAGALWRWEDEYTCDDGTGTFLLGVDEYIEDSTAMFGVWNIVSGTGIYTDLQGGGATDSIYGGYDASIGRLWTATNDN